MPLSKRLHTDHDQRGKKNDDHRPNGGSVGIVSRTWRGPRRKRIVLGLVGLWLLYIFFKNLPTDLPPVSQRYDSRLGRPYPPSSPHDPRISAPQGAPPRASKPSTEYYYDGPIKFYNLASTLGGGSSHDAWNVLFAASSLKSASNIVSMACDMSKQNRNIVHFVVLGRDDISIDAIEEINGVSSADCAIQWHDGRPDYSPYSSDERMEFSVRAALGHIHTFMRPQVILTDSFRREDGFFAKAMRDKAGELGTPLIELPENAADNLQWLTKLDAAALKAWNTFQIDILVYAPTESSGSLIRLLKSLSEVDFFGLSPPRLTVELPASVDTPTKMFLDTFRWPPQSDSASSRLTLRHRIHPERLTTTEASIRTVESFYPANIPVSHVLVLTSQAELSPLIYHYLVYSLLEYKYSLSAWVNAHKFLGISLDMPDKQLDDKNSMSSPRGTSAESPSPLFLWQAPGSNAVLYFGDKWAEFHSFLSNLATISSDLTKQTPNPKVVSENHPAWMEYLLQLTRARGYSVLYPAFAAKKDSAMVTVHNDLYQPPEEFTALEFSTSDSKEMQSPKPPHEKDVLTAQSEAETLQKAKAKSESTLTTRSPLLPLIFPDFSPREDSAGAYALPGLPDLPILSYNGELLTPSESGELAQAYAKEFALEFGGCTSADDRRGSVTEWSTDDLFCL